MSSRYIKIPRIEIPLALLCVIFRDRSAQTNRELKRLSEITTDDETKILATIESMPAAMKPSFLLDVEAGGATELEDLSGAISRLGRRAGVATPIHDVATAALGVRR